MQDMRTIRSDLLIVGNGLAGLRAAAAAAEKGIRVLVVSEGQSASPEIMGFDVPVVPEDSADLYYRDMGISGYGINNGSLARTLADCVMGEVRYLERIGMEFDRDEAGEYQVIHTLGTTYPRLIHCKSRTGAEGLTLMRRRCKELGVQFQSPVVVLSLLTDGCRILGAIAMDLREGTPVCYIAKAVILATGGCGAMQRISTYPRTIVGDGYAMAYRAGTDLVDMEFQQFEPCTFIYPPQIEGKVIATTLLRHGAELLNGEKKEFMADYGLTRENAQKGELARAMVAEVRAGRGTPHGGIYYNMTMMSPKFLYEDHKIFTQPAVMAGIDLTREMPEMMPAAHTNLGGIRIDRNCSTQVPNLFACGEVTGGLHGANRIGGSAGAETIVFGHIAGRSAAEYIETADFPETGTIRRAMEPEQEKLAACMERKNRTASAEEIRRSIGSVMTEHVGISRTAESLRAAEKEIGTLSETLSMVGAADGAEAAWIYHCENMLLLARMQIAASLLREESRGVFFREDFPTLNEARWKKNIVIRNRSGLMQLEVCDCEKDPADVEGVQM